MTDSPKKKKSGWDKIDPDLLAFAREPVSEEPTPGGFLTMLPEELLRNRREWAKILKEQPVPPAGQQANVDAEPPSEKKKSSWDKIDPDLLAFAREPVYEEPAPGGFPLPEELLRDRREWAKILKEQPLPPAEPSVDAKQGGTPASDTAERLIGPRNPDHPHVNTKPGERGPA